MEVCYCINTAPGAIATCSFLTDKFVTMTDPLKHLPPLPVERALKVISGRWKAVVLYHLLAGTRRLSDISRLLPQISQKVLVRQLREMEEHGLIQRTVHAQVPPRVDYALTPLGQTLEPILAALCAWGQRHAAELNEQGRIAECRFPDLDLQRQVSEASRTGAEPQAVE